MRSGIFPVQDLIKVLFQNFTTNILITYVRAKQNFFCPHNRSFLHQYFVWKLIYTVALSARKTIYESINAFHVNWALFHNRNSGITVNGLAYPDKLKCKFPAEARSIFWILTWMQFASFFFLNPSCAYDNDGWVFYF